MNMKIKKILAAVFITGALAASLGCGGGGKPTESNSSVAVTQKQEDIEGIFRKIYKKATSSKNEERLEVYSKNSAGFLFLKTALRDETQNTLNFCRNRDVKQAENIKISNVNRKGNYVAADVDYTMGGEAIHERDVIENVNGKWVVAYNQIVKNTPLAVACDDAGALEAAANLGETFDGDFVLLMDVRSKNMTTYSFGWVEPAKYVLVTDQGEFFAQSIPSVLDVPNGHWKIGTDPFRLTVPFKNAKGTPQALRVIGFNELNSRGLPANNNTAQEMTFWLKR